MKGGLVIKPIMIEFLLITALVWLVTASILDLKKREIPNWLSFSLIAVGLGYRAFFSALNADLWFFLFGLIGLGIFIALGYAFYYARVFAGGDAKLLMALGAVLPLSSGLLENLEIFLGFIILLLFAGSVYGLVFSFILVMRNRKKFASEFTRQFKMRKIIFVVALIFAFFSLFSVFYLGLIFVFFPLLFLLFPFLFVYAKSVEESCMIKEVNAKELTEGDWLYENIKVKGKIIKPYWEGLSEKEVKMFKNYKGKIKIKVGIPFVPAFFIAFIAFILLRYLKISVGFFVS